MRAHSDHDNFLPVARLLEVDEIADDRRDGRWLPRRLAVTEKHRKRDERCRDDHGKPLVILTSGCP